VIVQGPPKLPDASCFLNDDDLPDEQPSFDISQRQAEIVNRDLSVPAVSESRAVCMRVGRNGFSQKPGYPGGNTYGSSRHSDVLEVDPL